MSVEMMDFDLRKKEVIKLVEFNLDVIRLMLDLEQLKLSDKAIEKLLQYNWDSNCKKDLENILEKAARKCKNNIIEVEDLDQLLVSLDEDNILPLGLKLEELERKYILQTLFIVGQNRTKAAEILGISIRTLRNKISQYKMEGFL